MLKGKTKSGFEYEIDERIASDYRFFELIAEAEENYLLVPKLVNKILGEDGKNRLIKHLEKDGFAESEEVLKEVSEIIQKVGELKN